MIAPYCLRRAAIAGLLLAAVTSPAAADSLKIFNHSFETPVFADGGFDFLMGPETQGVYGWTITDGAAIYNPPAADFTNAGGQGTPLGADGPQIGSIYGGGDYSIYQRLAGPDGTVGNSDDPTLTPGTVYTLKLAIGYRNPSAISDWGGYDVQVRAGAGLGEIVGHESDGFIPPRERLSSGRSRSNARPICAPI